MMLTWRRTSVLPTLPWWWLGLVRWLLGWRAVPVVITTQRYGYLPWRFVHRGEIYQVWQLAAVIERGGRLPRRYFSVRCTDGTPYTLYQDLQAGTWHLER